MAKPNHAYLNKVPKKRLFPSVSQEDREEVAAMVIQWIKKGYIEPSIDIHTITPIFMLNKKTRFDVKCRKPRMILDCKRSGVNECSDVEKYHYDALLKLIPSIHHTVVVLSETLALDYFDN